MTAVKTDKVYLPDGPYSQAYIYKNLLFTSAFFGMYPTRQVPPNMKDQTIEMMENLKNVAAAAGTDINNAIRVSIFLVNVNDYDFVASIYKTYFKYHYPALSITGVSQLQFGALMKAEAIISIG